MTTRYVPDQYVDFASALAACVDGDTIELNTSSAILLPGLTSSLDDITVRAGEGKTPVLDHSILPDGGIGLTLGVATGWLFQGITFRDRNGGSASLSCHGAMEIADCIFEGCDFALRGNWAGTVTRTDFRHVLQYVATTNEDDVRFEACRFIACEVRALIVLEGEGSAVENCTLIRCRSGDLDYEDGLDLIEADVVRANTAQDCQALDPDSDRFIFRGNSICARNNAWNCTTEAGFFAGDGTVENNTEVDPQHVHPLLDLRLLPGSALIGAGSGAETALDRSGMAYMSPPNVGAHESARCEVAAVLSASQIQVGVTGGVPSLSACLDRESWRLETADGVQVAVVSATEVDQGEGETPYAALFVLELHPAMSPWQEYTVRLSPSLYGYDEDAFTPEVEPPAYPWRKYRNIAAVMNAFGIQIGKVVGRSEAELIHDFLPTDATIFVTSTRNFPSSGYLWLRDFRVRYTSKTDGAFHGITTVLPRLVAVPRGTAIVLDDRAYVPEP